MLKQIVFDIGNVLSDFRWKEAIADRGFSPEVSAVLGEKIFEGPYWKEYDRGVMGDEAVTAAIRATLGGYEAQMDELYGHFGEFVRERAYSQPLLRELKSKGYGIYILSNYGLTMYEKNARYFRFLPEADGVVFSYLEKLLKPDSAIYEVLLSRYGLKAGECLFLDDAMVNVEGARAVGMDSACVDSLEGIRRELATRGIVLEDV